MVGKLFIARRAIIRIRQAYPEGEVYEIYTIKPDGTDVKQITHDKGINTYPSFSPEGGEILFRKVLGEKNSQVFVMNGMDHRCEI